MAGCAAMWPCPMPSGDDLGAEANGEALGHEGILTVEAMCPDLYCSVVLLDTGLAGAEDQFNTSEQVPSLVRIGVRMDEGGAISAGGLLIQALPSRDTQLSSSRRQPGRPAAAGDAAGG